MSDIEQVIKTVGEGEDRYETQISGGIELRRFIGRGDGEWRQRDLDLGIQLGYPRPRDVRKLIKRLAADQKLNDLVVRATVARTSGGAPTDEFWLTEAQALKVAARSETDVADEILDRIIAVYQAVKRDARAALAGEVEEMRRRMALQEEAGKRRELEGAQALQAVQEQMQALKASFVQEMREARADKEVMGGMPITGPWRSWINKTFFQIATWRFFVNASSSFHSEHGQAQAQARAALMLPMIQWEDLPMSRMTDLRIYLRTIWKQARRKAIAAGWVETPDYQQPKLPGFDDDEGSGDDD